LRWITERLATPREHGGTAVLVGNDVELIRDEYRKILNQDRKPSRPKLWDGKTASRCMRAILEYKK